MGITIFWGRGPGIRATLCTYLQPNTAHICALLSRRRDAKAKNDRRHPAGWEVGGQAWGKGGAGGSFFAGDRRSALVGSLPCPVLRDPGLFVFWFCWSGDPHHRINPHVSDVLWRGGWLWSCKSLTWLPEHNTWLICNQAVVFPWSAVCICDNGAVVFPHVSSHS